MNENEAKAIVREIIMNYAENGEEKYCEALDTAVKALEEVQQYRALETEVEKYRQIGTPEEFRVSVEKQTAKKPYLQPVQKNEYREDECWECPSCDPFLDMKSIAEMIIIERIIALIAVRNWIGRNEE